MTSDNAEERIRLMIIQATILKHICNGTTIPCWRRGDFNIHKLSDLTSFWLKEFLTVSFLNIMADF